MARLSHGSSNIPVSASRKRMAGTEDPLPSDRKRPRTSLRSGLLAKSLNASASNSTPRRRASASGSYSTPNRAPPSVGGTPIPESARKPTTVLARPVPEPESDTEDYLLIHGPSSVTRSATKRKRSSAGPGSTARKAHVRINYTPRSTSSRKQSAGRHPQSEDHVDVDGEDTFAFTKAGQAIRARQTSPSPASGPEPEDLFFDASQEMDGGADFDMGQDSFAPMQDPDSDDEDQRPVQHRVVDDVSFSWPVNETATTHNPEDDSQGDQTLVLTSTQLQDPDSEQEPSDSESEHEAELQASTSLFDLGPPDTSVKLDVHVEDDSLSASERSLTMDLGALGAGQQDQSRLTDMSLPQGGLAQNNSVMVANEPQEEEDEQEMGYEDEDYEAEAQEVAQILSSPAQHVQNFNEQDIDDGDDDDEPLDLPDALEFDGLGDLPETAEGHGSSSPLRSTDGSPTLKPAAFRVHVDPPQSSSPRKTSFFNDEPQMSTIDQLREALSRSRRSVSPAGPSRTLQPSPQINSAPLSPNSRQKLGSPLEEHASSARDLFTPSPSNSPQQASKKQKEQDRPVSEPEKPASPAQETAHQVHPAHDETVQDEEVVVEHPGNSMLEALEEPTKPRSPVQELFQKPAVPSSPPQTSSDAAESSSAAFVYRVEELSSPRGNVQSKLQPDVQIRAATSPMQLASQLRAVHSRSQSPAVQREDGDMGPPALPSSFKSPSRSPRKSATKRPSEQRGSLAFATTSSPPGSMPDMPSLSGFLGSPAKISAVREANGRREPSTSRVTIEDQMEENAPHPQLDGFPKPNLIPSDSTSPMSSPVRNLQWRRSVSGSHSSVKDKTTSPTRSESSPRPTARPGHTPKQPSSGGIRSLADISADADEGSDEDLMSVGSNMSPVRPGDIPRSTKKLIEELTSSPSAGLMSSPASDLYRRSPRKIFGSPLKAAVRDAEQEAEEERQQDDDSQAEESMEQEQALLQSPFQHDISMANDTFEAVRRGTVANRTQTYEASGRTSEAPADSSFSGHGDTTVMPFPQGNAAVANSVNSHSSRRSQSLRTSLHRRSLSGSTIEIRSADPEIAARVAAILTQQHDYHINKNDSPETIEEKHRLREVRLQELLRKAELEVSSQVDEHSRYGGSPVQHRSPAQPRVGSANLEVPTSRHIMRQHAWSKSDWRRLEICLKQLQRQAWEAGESEPRPEPEDVVAHFLDQLALTEEALEGHWSKQKLLYRAEALLEHRCHPKSKSFLVASRHDRATSTGMSSRASSVGFIAYDAHEKRKDAQSGRGLFSNLGSILGL